MNGNSEIVTAAPAEAKAQAAVPFYVIATAPRTGSTLLTEALTATGLAGSPDEFFDIHAENEQRWVQRYRIAKDAPYIGQLQAATSSPNGVFGFKLHWHQMPALAKRLLETRPKTGRTAHSAFELIQERFPGSKFIWLTRKNKVAQAISYYRASETNVWRAWDDARPVPRVAKTSPDYNRLGIERHLRMVNTMDTGWRQFFATNRVPPLLLFYEDFVESYELTVRRVLAWLGLPADGVVLKPPSLLRLADAESKAWEERFRREMAPAQQAVAAPAMPAPQIVVEGESPLPQPATKPTTVRKSRSVRSAATTGKAKPAPLGLPLIAYDVGSAMKTNLTPGKPNRAWMNETPSRFAYRCLPMVIANQWGWMLETRHRVEAVWDGSQPPTGLVVTTDGDEQSKSASSHFGSGVLTFHVGFLFRTPPGFNLHVRGPANWPKDGACPLEGIVETDWLDSTFTMNWKLTRPNHPVVFEAGEPIAMISPVRRGELEAFLAEIQPLSANQDMFDNYTAWSKSRDAFNADLKVTGSEAKKAGWQKDYTRGRTITGDAAPEHQTALELKEFTDKR